MGRGEAEMRMFPCEICGEPVVDDRVCWPGPCKKPKKKRVTEKEEDDRRDRYRI